MPRDSLQPAKSRKADRLTLKAQGSPPIKVGAKVQQLPEIWRYAAAVNHDNYHLLSYYLGCCRWCPQQVPSEQSLIMMDRLWFLILEHLKKTPSPNQSLLQPKGILPHHHQPCSIRSPSKEVIYVNTALEDFLPAWKQMSWQSINLK